MSDEDCIEKHLASKKGPCAFEAMKSLLNFVRFLHRENNAMVKIKFSPFRIQTKPLTWLKSA